MIPEAILRAIQAAHRILCLSHVEPDGDAYGSILGLKWLLEGAGKQVSVGIDGSRDDIYAFLPGFKAVKAPQDIHGKFDLVIIADASSPDRMGKFRTHHAVKHTPWLVIDHHPTSLMYGSEGLNWVVPTFLSTCNMILHLARALEYALPVRAQQCLMAGMITDTQCFQVYGTDRAFMEDVLAVMGPESFSPYDIVSRTISSLSYETLRLWAEVLPTMQLEDGVIWLTIQEEQLNAEAGERPSTRGLIQKLMEVREARAAVIFMERTQTDGTRGVICSMRCRPDYDVSRLALSYDGGGHKMAAGCFIASTLWDVVPRVVDELKFAVSG